METEIKDLGSLQKRLKTFSARAKFLQGHMLKKDKNGQTQLCSIGAEVAKFFDELLNSTTDPEKIRNRNEFLARAAKDPKVKDQLCAIRIESFNNYIFATLNIISFFFEHVPLKPDERPVFQNTTLNEVKVYYNGPEGESRNVRVDRDDQFELKNLHFLTTDKVRYKVIDVYRGNIVDAAMQTLRLAYDWNNQAEGVAFNLINSSAVYGAFTFTGAKQNYPYVANSRINTANLPATNDIGVYTNNTTGKYAGLAANGTAPATSSYAGFIGFPVFDAIKDYCNRWIGSDPEKELAPTGRILVPGSEIYGVGQSVTPTSARPSDSAEQIIDDGWVRVHYLGTDWSLVPDNTIPLGTCYPEFNLKVGRYFTKPSLDQEKVINTPELDEKNEEERYMRKVVGFEANSASRRFTARFTYHG